MKRVLKLLKFVLPYWKGSLAALLLVVGVVLLDLSIPRLVQRIIDQGILVHDFQVVIQTFVLMLGISLVDTVFAVGNNIFSIRVGEGVMRDVRGALFHKIESFSFGNIDKINTGQLMVRLTSDASVFERLVHVSLRVGTRAPLMMIGSIILMFGTDRQLALTMLPILLVTMLTMAFFIARMGPLFLRMLQKLDKLNSILQENISGIRLIKAFVRKDHEQGKFAVANEEYARRNIVVMRLMATMSPAMSVCVNLGIVMVVWAGGLQAINGSLTTGEIVAFVNYFLAILAPLSSLVNLANVWAAAIASAERIDEVLQTAPQVQDAPGAHPIPPDNSEGIVFEHVCFHYGEDGGEWVLEDVSFTAKPGETIAILGATGAGKSTLVNLIPRFYDATTGRVLVNGVDVKTVRQDSLLAQIGFVPQESVLFSGSVRYNISYGLPSAPDEEITKVARAAQIHDFIMTLPKGYETRVEERGVNLSGGQKQRIAIARALLMQPQILILDDSTSSVDVETETRIQTAIRQRLGDFRNPRNLGGICFIVAQRISTVLKADQILVLDKGRIAAQGTHRELLKSSPDYQEIYNSQLGEGNHGHV